MNSQEIKDAIALVLMCSAAVVVFNAILWVAFLLPY